MKKIFQVIDKLISFLDIVRRKGEILFVHVILISLSFRELYGVFYFLLELGKPASGAS